MKVVIAVVRTGKHPSVTFTKEQPEPKPVKKAAKKATKKPATKKSTTRGKAVVVYFNMDNLDVLKKAKAAAKKQDVGLNEIVAVALRSWMK